MIISFITGFTAGALFAAVAVRITRSSLAGGFSGFSPARLGRPVGYYQCDGPVSFVRIYGADNAGIEVT